MSDELVFRLINLGNSCYFNVCLQLLAHCDNFLTELSNATHLNSTCDEANPFLAWIQFEQTVITTSEQPIWQAQQSTRKPIKRQCYTHIRAPLLNPSTFYSRFIAYCEKKDLMYRGTQNDATECLHVLLEIIHQSLNRPIPMKDEKEAESSEGGGSGIGSSEGGEEEQESANNIISAENIEQIIYCACSRYWKMQAAREYSAITKHMTGISFTLIRSMETANSCSIVPELFTILHLPASGNSLQECLAAYTHMERLEEPDNLWFNDKTQRREKAIKAQMIYALPRTLFIVFERMTTPTAETIRRGNTKLDHYIHIPLQWNVEQELCADGKKRVYELIGVINHTGSSFGGHYNMTLKHNQMGWVMLDDNMVYPWKKDDVVSKNAYCVMFQQQL